MNFPRGDVGGNIRELVHPEDRNSQQSNWNSHQKSCLGVDACKGIDSAHGKNGTEKQSNGQFSQSTPGRKLKRRRRVEKAAQCPGSSIIEEVQATAPRAEHDCNPADRRQNYKTARQSK